MSNSTQTVSQAHWDPGAMRWLLPTTSLCQGPHFQWPYWPASCLERWRFPTRWCPVCKMSPKWFFASVPHLCTDTILWRLISSCTLHALAYFMQLNQSCTFRFDFYASNVSDWGFVTILVYMTEGYGCNLELKLWNVCGFSRFVEEYSVSGIVYRFRPVQCVWFKKSTSDSKQTNSGCVIGGLTISELYIF